MECCCYLRTVHDRMADGKTAYEKRFAVTCDGPSTPFGAKVSCKPIASRAAAKLRQFCRKMLPDISMGDVSRAGWGWSGDLLLANCEDLENLPASDIHVKRFKLQDIAQEGKLLFPRAVGSLKLCDLPQRRGEKPAKGNPEPAEEEEKEDTLFEKEKRKICLRHERLLHISP